MIIPSKALGRLIFTGQRQIGAVCSWSFDFCSLEVTLISSLKKDSNASTGDICSATPCHRQDHKPVEYVAPEILFICVSFEYTVLRFGISPSNHQSVHYHPHQGSLSENTVSHLGNLTREGPAKKNQINASLSPPPVSFTIILANHAVHFQALALQFSIASSLLPLARVQPQL